jgi:hypothetical protein
MAYIMDTNEQCIRSGDKKEGKHTKLADHIPDIILHSAITPLKKKLLFLSPLPLKPTSNAI